MNNPNAPYNPNQFDNQISNTTTIGMDAKLAVLLSYIIGIIGIVVLITEKDNKFVKFHALQSLLFHILVPFIVIGLFALIFVLWIVVAIVGASLGSAGAALGAIFSIIFFIVWIAMIFIVPITVLGGNIYSAIQAYNGKWFKLPVVGNLSAKMLGLTIHD